MTYLTVEHGAGMHLLKNKGTKIFDSIKMMRQGDMVRVPKSDLACFYAVARRNHMQFRRKKDGDGFLMVMVENGFLKSATARIEQNKQRIIREDNREDGW
jgi:hypothetical protein